MNRRAFLQGLVAAFAAPIVAKAAGASTSFTVADAKRVINAVWRDFDPSREYGMAVLVTYRDENAVDLAKKAVLESAREHLPPGTTFAVLDSGPVDFGFAHYIAWYYNPTGYAKRGAAVLGLATT